MRDDPAIEPWRIDKHIPLALILTIVGQTFGLGWWAASISERVTALEVWRIDSKDVAADIAVMKSQVTEIRSSVKRIEDYWTQAIGSESK